MKIAIDLTSLADSLSGLQRFAENTAYGLISVNPGIGFIPVFRGEVPERFKPLLRERKIEAVVLPRRNKLIFRLFTLPLGLMRLKADKWLFPAFPPPVLFARRGTYTAIHDMCCFDCPETMTLPGRLRFRFLFRKAKLLRESIITVSQFSKRRIHDILGIPNEKIHVVPNGVDEKFLLQQGSASDAESVRERYKLPDKYILCLSTLEPRKNMQLLVKACSELWQEGALEAELVIAGRKGWKTEDMLAAVPERFRERIHFTGFAADDDLPLIYRMAEAFVFPSLYEGFGIPPLEALAAGTCVISSDAEAMKETLGTSAAFFKNDDLASLKQTLLEGMRSKPAADTGIIEKYSWKAAAESLGKALNL